MTAKYQHEDTALQAFRDELVARGRRAEITAYPDRDPAHPLTVDALISIDGVEWAVDHCLVSRPQLLPAALKAAEAVLRPRIEAIAQTYGCVIQVSYLPQTGAKGVSWGADYYDRIVQLAEKAVTVQGLIDGEDSFATAQAFPSKTPDVHLIPFTDTTGNPSVSTQVDAGLRDPLLKKLAGQLKRAKEAGLPTALLLDQIPRSDVNSHAVWLAAPVTIAATVAAILHDHDAVNPKVLDQVWLRPTVHAAIQPGFPSIHQLI
ncbi:hypothetical protein FHR32_002887 [Streptosporangium album]|uniref:Uncharacterized protein n=1 Tax=Streptosporangium album TaxID=47479 RepID=A0A7W7RUW5_9ACTN|nr:hypothetical protein [Streptosporangium album]MBB4938582.1 hypothetical protein [Streptosporangium album]